MTSCKPVSFSRRTLHHAVSKLVYEKIKLSHIACVSTTHHIVLKTCYSLALLSCFALGEVYSRLCCADIKISFLISFYISSDARVFHVISFLRPLAELRKSDYLLRYVCLHTITRLPLDGFS